LVTLRGNTHLLAQSQYDQGAVPDALPLHRMLLLLQRSPLQETALRQFLDAQQDKSSASFHAWLTPEQFGAQYGPAAADLQTVTSWLAAQGFTMNRVSAGRTIIEFDGTAAQVRNTFHTQIHRYLVHGQVYTANSSDPQIPAALTPVVAGIVSLHNFPAQSHLRTVGVFKRSRAAGTVEPLSGPLRKPLYTPPNGFEQYPLVPGDFATIYNVTPLWNAGIDGTGQTIAIVGETDIDVADIQSFRALFGLSNNFSSSNIILDGIDPGITGDETEADLDIEWSGAVAKNATIDFVVSAATEVTGGTHLSALYIVDHNLAGVLSESYGNCEASLGSANNLYYSSLWEQAAAQGITVVLSAGDGGSAGCDNFDAESAATLGLAVSGYASTPFNVAVGGTDFDQINKWPQYWSATNDPVTLASALGYIPEVPWNDSCAQLGLGGCGSSQPGGDFDDIIAGSGGVSTIYPKPSWQSGKGVPADNKRDIPDVSFFASNDFSGTGYLICENDYGANCAVSGDYFPYLTVGGTSASAPSFAGIMALINQSQAQQSLGNRQGNANYILYALAKQQGNVTPALNCNASGYPAAACTFYDVTSGNSFYSSSGVGNNSVPCVGASPNCSSHAASIDGILVNSSSTPAYTTSAGYDLATGLGSVNAQNLAANWKSANSVPTTTTLSLNSGSAVNITHGSPVSVSASVSPTAAVGDVALVANYPNGSTLGMAQFTLANGAVSGSTSNLAGGNYRVTAHYEGDGTHAPSDSSSVSVTVAPEASKTFVTVPTFDPNSGKELSNSPTSVVYASPYILRADVTNSTGSLTQLCAKSNVLSCPSGSVAITDSVNGGATQPVDAPSFALNSAGYTEDQTVQLQGGAHMLVAQYAGDNSYIASSSTPYALTVTPASATIQLGQYPANGAIINQNFLITASVNTAALGGAVETGAITFYDGSTPLAGTVIQNGEPGASPALYANLTTSFTTAGTHSLSAKYSGDANYSSSTTASVNISAFYPTSMTLSITPANIIYGTSVSITATVNTGNKSPLLTGNVTFASAFSGTITNLVTQTINTDANGNTQLVATVSFTPQTSDTITAFYSGDTNYASFTQGASVQVTTPDFSIVSAPPSIAITAGQIGTATLTITPASHNNSTVTLTCNNNGIPVGSVCSISPSSVNLSNGMNGSATVSVTSIAPSAATPNVVAPRKSWLTGFDLARRHFPRGPAGVALSVWWSLTLVAGILALDLSLPAAGRRPARRCSIAALAAALLCIASFALGCGGGGGSVITPPPVLATTTTVVTSPTPKVSVGTPATLTATVTSSKSPTGTVTFYANGSSVAGPIVLLNGSAQTQVTFGSIGTLSITATYSGDANNAPSTSTTPFNQVLTGSTSFVVQAQTGVNYHQTTINLTLQ
jgi:subtilase family serine protease